MNLETRKLNIISWVSGLEDESIIDKIEKLRFYGGDWWEMIDENEKANIKKGILQADSGEVKTSEDVFSKYRKWL